MKKFLVAIVAVLFAAPSFAQYSSGGFTLSESTVYYGARVGLNVSTLTGDGTVHHPLGLSGTFKTGVLAPVKAVIDLTNGGYIPEVAALGTRYVTKEYVNDYGYLYNGAGVAKISERISNGWRVPEKKDWDALLNSLEPCKYKNHGSAKCHVELGLNAGAYLKSECGWN